MRRCGEVVEGIDFEDKSNGINAIEQADGAYRFHSRKHDCYLSVANTYTTANRANEHCAYAILDNAYKRVEFQGISGEGPQEE